MVLAVEPAHAGARSVASGATQALLDESSNFWESAWLRRALHRLERA
jgi:hypothetical protein